MHKNAVYCPNTVYTKCNTYVILQGHISVTLAVTRVLVLLSSVSQSEGMYAVC